MNAMQSCLWMLSQGNETRCLCDGQDPSASWTIFLNLHMTHAYLSCYLPRYLVTYCRYCGIRTQHKRAFLCRAAGHSTGDTTGQCLHQGRRGLIACCVLRGVDILVARSMGQGAGRAAGSTGFFFFAVRLGKGLDRLWRLTKETALSIQGSRAALDQGKPVLGGRDSRARFAGHLPGPHQPNHTSASSGRCSR